MPNKEPKKIILYCSKCDITKEIELVEKNMPSKDLGIWPLFWFPSVQCSQCFRMVEAKLKE